MKPVGALLTSPFDLGVIAMIFNVLVRLLLIHPLIGFSLMVMYFMGIYAVAWSFIARGHWAMGIFTVISVSQYTKGIAGLLVAEVSIRSEMNKAHMK